MTKHINKLIKIADILLIAAVVLGISNVFISHATWHKIIEGTGVSFVWAAAILFSLIVNQLIDLNKNIWAKTEENISYFLEPGTYVNTKWGWEALITNIDKSKFKHGQGVEVLRVSDRERFSIHPFDVTSLVEQ